jgi:hypothetical protein
MQMKNNISSIGKLPIYTPVRYSLLKPQMPSLVKNSSQTIKIIPGIRRAGQRYFHFFEKLAFE